MDFGPCRFDSDQRHQEKFMSQIIALANQKGGTGKTTTAVNLLSALAELGKRVLLIDFDPQGNATSGLGINPDKGIYEALSGRASVLEVIKKTQQAKFDLIPSTTNLAGANVELVDEEEREFRLKKILENIRENYDYILIDCPPSLGLLTINGLVAADKVLIPVQCEYYALEGLGQLLGTINLVKQNLQPNLEILGALLTMHDKRTKLSKDVILEMRTRFPYKVFDTVIPRNIRLAEAPSFGKSVLKYSSWSDGARAYRNLAREIIKFT